MRVLALTRVSINSTPRHTLYPFLAETHSTFHTPTSQTHSRARPPHRTVHFSFAQNVRNALRSTLPSCTLSRTDGKRSSGSFTSLTFADSPKRLSKALKKTCARCPGRSRTRTGAFWALCGAETVISGVSSKVIVIYS